MLSYSKAARRKVIYILMGIFRFLIKNINSSRRFRTLSPRTLSVMEIIYYLRAWTMKTCSGLSGKWFLALCEKNRLNILHWCVQTVQLLKLFFELCLTKKEMLICHFSFIGVPLLDIFHWNDVRNEHLEPKIDMGHRFRQRSPTTCHGDLYCEQKI